ncbi:MAG: GGDEF domain-containing protein [Rhodanobacteraceae bacterium]
MTFNTSTLRRMTIVWRSVLVLLLLCPVALGAYIDPMQELNLADTIKSSDHDQFKQILAELEQSKNSLPDDARWRLSYLQAWELAYRGQYTKASSQLSLIIRDCPNRDLRFRAQVTQMNIDTVSLQYDSAFQRLVKLIAEVPEITSQQARTQFYATAAILYNKVGEYDLATSAADKLLTADSSSDTLCKGRYFKLLAAYNGGQLSTRDPAIEVAQRTCAEANESMLGNSLRILLAKLDLSRGNPVSALAILTPHYNEVLKTGYAELISDFEAEMAQAYLQSGDPKNAAIYARRVVSASTGQDFSESLAAACKTLYEIYKARGDTAAALSWYEQYTSADKGYLNEVTAKSLAYQKVKQRVQASQARADAAQKQNRILQLQQTLSEKVAETRGLYATLLLIALVVLCVWVLRLLRSQQRLRKLAEIDSLTSIYNRQYFVNAGGLLLEACKKEGANASLILIDLDHFKLVNDTHGHATGDAVLKRTALACQGQLRANDLFGRLGGEEFGIVMPNCELDMAVEYAERIRSAIAALSSASDDTPNVTASAGVASTARANYDLRQLMIHADDALYRAKRDGRNRVAVSDGTISIVRTTFSTVG